ncbi:GTPase Era [Aliibacillus thermotolerans]|uniref:GTPase Era n=1 Tax=Aliibacillus thermotolerans TaxID=1834418 RepID=A0ABW0UCS1_9BACI|nr:GTPase Era [Aliibacillus thermotolerans]MDA3130735.1 GTPase Era [Aliibacillus thermotolerans]
MNETYKSGFVALVGRPNVGKSTLLNYIVGEKIAIMSDKPQTTRNKIQGIYTSETAQLIFIDTPGIHKPKHQLGDFMVRAALSTFREVDLILFVVDVNEPYGQGEKFILEKLKETNTPVFLVLNKIDRMHPEQLLEKIAAYRELYQFAEIIPVSALNGNNVTTLMEQIIRYMDEGPQYYPADEITDHPERFIVSEFIREKIIHLTEEEVPHSIAVVIEEMKERKGGMVYISALVLVERQSQKGIIIGKQGNMLKEIGKRARKDIEALLGSNVYLDLFVKVDKNWRNNRRQLSEYGYDQTHLE